MTFLLSSDQRSDREAAVNIILQIRGNDEFGSKSTKINSVCYSQDYDPEARMKGEKIRKPIINIYASSVLELIPRKDFQFESIFSADLDQRQLLELKEEKLILPKREGFTQNIERIIRRLNEASAIYWQKSRRDAHIRAQQHVSLVVKRSITKQDFLPFLKIFHRF